MPQQQRTKQFKCELKKERNSLTSYQAAIELLLAIPVEGFFINW
jgi:hypothetical protein